MRQPGGQALCCSLYTCAAVPARQVPWPLHPISTQSCAKLNPSKKSAGNVAVLHDSQAEVLAHEN